MTGLQAATALALRRAAIVTAGVVVTFVAHAAAYGHAPRLGHAAVVLGTAVAAAVMLGPRAGDFVPRSRAATVAVLVLVQAGAHAAMWAAPWAFGFGAHHPVPALTAAALVTHLGAALALAPALAALERALAAAVHAVRRLRRLIALRVPGAARSERVRALRVGAARHPVLLRFPARGPPAGSSPA